MRWKKRPGDKNQAPLWYSGDYVIVQRGDYHLLYRPPGLHGSIGRFHDLKEAKQVASLHARLIDS